MTNTLAYYGKALMATVKRREREGKRGKEREREGKREREKEKDC